ncbi:MAG TPA: pyridoxamine 5'-phosphate oxidase [Chitinophagaceae bacterium]|nr:pyridoxamine 5'-phosphate oxidase [Chitinophagaceae bacterium]HNF71020.1 pyridoxamine 5'-phosphate oxidase [Chitinophagaceae bacterium]
MPDSIADIRQEYLLASLHRSDLHQDPLTQFIHWFADAQRAEIPDVNAMTLSTCDHHYRSHSRIVLLKGVEEGKFIFFTNYQSAKGRELDQVPQASLVFYFKELQRQIRVEGSVGKLSAEQSEAYFASRPRESQLGAWASIQSEPLDHRSTLENRYRELEASYQGRSVPKPPHWGGYALDPDYMEFWQGRMSRLHDRFAYRKEAGHWKLDRLNP